VHQQGPEAIVSKYHPNLWERIGLVYTSRSEKRLKLTRRARWAFWSFSGGLILGILASRVLPLMLG
jgi:hypothetical protein